MKGSNRSFYVYLIILNLFIVISYTFNYLHFPPPFFYDLNDTFMDFYHVLEWSNRTDIYTEWKSIYPPFTFIVTQALGGLFYEREIIDNVFNFRLDTIGPFLLTYALLILITLSTDLKRIEKDKLFFILFIYGTSPFLYALERGNLILITYLFLALSIYFYDKKIGVFFLAAAISLKIYLISFLFIYFMNRDFGKVISSVFFLYLINEISAIILGVDDWLLMFRNIISFSGDARYYEWSYYTYSYKNLFGVLIFKEIFDPNLLSLIDLIFSFFALGVFAWVSVNYTFYNEKYRDDNRNTLLILLLILILMLVKNAGGYAFLLLFVFYKELLNSKYTTLLVFIATFPIDILIGESKSFTEYYSFIGGEYHYSEKGLYLGMLLRPLSLMLLYLYFFNSFLNKYIFIRSRSYS